MILILHAHAWGCARTGRDKWHAWQRPMVCSDVLSYLHAHACVCTCTHRAANVSCTQIKPVDWGKMILYLHLRNHQHRPALVVASACMWLQLQVKRAHEQVFVNGGVKQRQRVFTCMPAATRAQ